MVTKENGEEMVRQGDEMDEGIGICFRVRGEGVYIGKRKKSEIGKDGVN
ncbi:hypothetical protein RchiOBHm_Chr7g0229971 [Rosa chinensis]|uniref:Uncharacterized protein n=1 Tax=Rosa chinensis TaxID=74649 RepID=A0A2P6PF98_ROSCH|nr:hypothetical protein RchiOBHm_Chr7g0229971 [Rosa chinensis]